jgi:hypothetical protein
MKCSVGIGHVSLFILLQHDYSLLLVIVVMMSVYDTRSYGGWSCCPTRSRSVQQIISYQLHVPAALPLGKELSVPVE